MIREWMKHMGTITDALHAKPRPRTAVHPIDLVEHLMDGPKFAVLCSEEPKDRADILRVAMAFGRVGFPDGSFPRILVSGTATHMVFPLPDGRIVPVLIKPEPVTISNGALVERIELRRANI